MEECGIQPETSESIHNFHYFDTCHTDWTDNANSSQVDTCHTDWTDNANSSQVDTCHTDWTGNVVNSSQVVICHTDWTDNVVNSSQVDAFHTDWTGNVVNSSQVYCDVFNGDLPCHPVEEKNSRVKTEIIIQNEVLDGQPVNAVYMFDVSHDSAFEKALAKPNTKVTVKMIPDQVNYQCPNDLQIPKQATVNSITGQIDQHTFICLTCGIKFSSMQEFQEHQEIHNRPATPKIADGHTHSDSGQSVQEGHCDSMELDITSQECTPRFKCSELGSLQTNQQTDVVENAFVCQVCDDTFTNEEGLKAHGSIHKFFICQFCKKEFRFKGSLVIHERTHTGEKPFKCDCCEMQFSSKGSLVVHERTHSRRKPFKCPICSKVFSQSSSMKTHQRVHIDEKPFKCHFCEKQFRYIGNLRVHNRTHSGLKPFQCTICTKLFSQSSSLKTHQRMHDGDVSLTCKFCNKCFSRRRSAIRHECPYIDTANSETSN